LNRGVKEVLSWLKDAHAQAVDTLEGYTQEEAERLAEEAKIELLKVAETEDEREYANSIGVARQGNKIFIGPLLERTKSGAKMDQIARTMEYGATDQKPRPVWRRLRIL
jgi:hypothetical protein